MVLPMLMEACFCSARREFSQCQDCRRDPSSCAQEPYQQQNTRLHSAAASQPPNPKPVATRRTPRKRALSLLDQDMVAPPREARGHARGNREASRDDSSDTRDQEAAHFLDGKVFWSIGLIGSSLRGFSLPTHTYFYFYFLLTFIAASMSVSMLSACFGISSKIPLRSYISQTHDSQSLGEVTCFACLLTLTLKPEQ